MGCFDRSPQGKSGVNVRLITLSVRGGLWVAPVHTLHMPKPVITFVFKVLRNGLLRYTLHMPKPVITFVFKVLRNGLLPYILTHAQTCDYVRVQSATQWTGSVHTRHMPKPVFPYKGTYLDCAYFCDF